VRRGAAGVIAGRGWLLRRGAGRCFGACADGWPSAVVIVSVGLGFHCWAGRVIRGLAGSGMGANGCWGVRGALEAG
jgi:hypothetical protein